MVDSLLVFYNDRKVGELLLERNSVFFSYDQTWIENGFSISPRSLPLIEGLNKAKSPYFEGFFGVFADSLPGGWGTRLSIAKLREAGIDYESIPLLEKLLLVGEDGLGALSYRPNNGLKGCSEIEDYDDFFHKVNLFDIKKETSDIDSLYLHAFASGGVKPKAHILYKGEEWIVKFPQGKDPSDIGKMEYQYNLAARSCGIELSDFALLSSKNGDPYFATKRFDRKNGKHVHVLSLSAFLESPHYLPNLDYVSYLQSIGYLTSSLPQVLEGYRRACFNVLAQNKDDHSKNFAFYYDEERKSYRLAPAYDLTYTPNIKEHEMTCMGKGNPSEEDLLNLARKMNLPYQKAATILEEVKASIKEHLSEWVAL